jgi:hypothetical protein
MKFSWGSSRKVKGQFRENYLVFISALSVCIERIRPSRFPRNAVQDLNNFVKIDVVKDILCLEA